MEVEVVAMATVDGDTTTPRLTTSRCDDGDDWRASGGVTGESRVCCCNDVNGCDMETAGIETVDGQTAAGVEVACAV